MQFNRILSFISVFVSRYKCKMYCAGCLSIGSISLFVVSCCVEPVSWHCGHCHCEGGRARHWEEHCCSGSGVQQLQVYTWMCVYHACVCRSLLCYRMSIFTVLPYVDLYCVTVCRSLLCYRMSIFTVLPYVDLYCVTVCRSLLCYRMSIFTVLPYVDLYCVTVC